MTGRSRIPISERPYYYPSSYPTISIGISLSISPPKIDPSSDQPLHLTISARILKTPWPGKPITFSAHLNPFGSLHHYCFTNIICTTNNKSKKIVLWPNYNIRRGGILIKNIRNCSHFITVKPGETWEERHEVPRDKILAAGLEKGEKYTVKITDVGLGTDWWTYGTLDDFEGVKFMKWFPTQEEAERFTQLLTAMGQTEEEEEEEKGPWLMSEEPDKFSLVIEKRDAEIEII